MHFTDRLATLHHRSERASGPRECRYRRATVGHSGRVRRVGILAVAVLALAVGAIERRTVGDHWEPLGSDGMWTKRGPGLASVSDQTGLLTVERLSRAWSRMTA